MISLDDNGFVKGDGLGDGAVAEGLYSVDEDAAWSEGFQVPD